ncbi:MAG: AI-2E family transporter [Candidatus Limnocylindrales bacterium]
MDAGIGSWTRRGIGFAIGVIFVAAIVVGLIVTAQLVALVFIAILFASALGPLVDRLRARAPFGRATSTGLLFLAGAAIVVFLGAILVTTAVQQVSEIGDRLPSMIRSARATAADLQPAPLGAAAGALLDALDRAVRRTPAPTADQVLLAGVTIAEVIGALATVVTLIYFWLLERARIQRFALAFLPLDRRAGIRQAWNDVEDGLGRWVRGQLVIMVLMGVSTGIAYTVLGVPGAVVLGLTAGLFEAVPIVGPLLGAVPALLVAATVRPELIAAVAIVYAIVQLAEANIVVPMVMRNTVGLSPFIVLVSLLLGAGLAGILGAFLAIPVAASVEIILERLQSRDVPVGLEPGPTSEDADDEDGAAAEHRPTDPVPASGG